MHFVLTSKKDVPLVNIRPKKMFPLILIGPLHLTSAILLRSVAEIPKEI